MRFTLFAPLILVATCIGSAARPARAESGRAAKPAEVRTTLPPTPQQQALAARATSLKQPPTARTRAVRSALAPKPWRPTGLKPNSVSTIRTRPDGPLTPAQLRKAASGPAGLPR
ncbi:MAG TPA: hypothetical protein VFK69_10890 [Candidatus Eisenbacteria bacterium]|nr:hypothetical protein [Candidatus Eisenbacteria bacterium]